MEPVEAEPVEAATAEVAANAQRFRGFADLYDRVRPSPPDSAGQIILAYAGAIRAGLVVDLGSGTGLSSRWAARWSDRVIGVEPSEDMRLVAAQRAAADANVSFEAGYAHDTGLPGGGADVVLAVQALHWMDPVPTLAEIARLLRPGGVFAALDCDFPPLTGCWEAEAAWLRCRERLVVFENRVVEGDTGDALRRPVPEDWAAPEHYGLDYPSTKGLAGGGRSWSKPDHLARLAASGHFRWCTEFAVTATEVGDQARFVDLFCSQGHTQALLNAGLDENTLGITALAATAASALGEGARPFWFTYRVRLAIK